MKTTPFPDPTLLSTPPGIPFAMLPPHAGAAPTLLLLAWSGMDTLAQEPYCIVGQLLYARGWNVVSLDLPCHGADQRQGEPAEIPGWAARIAQGEDIVAPFQQRACAVLDHLVAAGIADPARIAAAGTSRGGYMAFQAAATCPRLRAVAAFAPLTDLLALREFTGQEANPLVQRLALVNAAAALADRAAWITIGNDDDRVGTDKAVAFARALVAAGRARHPLSDVSLHVLPAAGHASFPSDHEHAAAWLLETVTTAPHIPPG